MKLNLDIYNLIICQQVDMIRTIKIFQQFKKKANFFNALSTPKVRFSVQKQPTKIQLVLKKYNAELEQSKIMQKIAPRQFTEADLDSLSYKLRFSGSKNHLESLNKGLSQPMWDLLDRGGKRWRPVLAMLVAELFGRNRKEVLDFAAFCQVLHNGSLIVDDIEDNSDTRRKKPCIHKIYGVDVAINTGNFMYFSPLLYLLNSPKYSLQMKNQFAKIYAEECTHLHLGQNWDIIWHNSNHIIESYPNESQYLQMTAFKTSVLPRLAVRMISAFAGSTKEQDDAVTFFVENMGVGFQIQDDLLNLQGEQFKTSKGYNGEDIHEGKITLMVINHVQNASDKDKKRLVQILQMKTSDSKLIEEAIDLLKKSGSIDYAKGVMHKLIEEGNKHLDLYFPHSQTRQLLKELASYGITRKK